MAAQSPLAAGAEYTQTQTVTIPDVGGGTFYLLFVADSYGYQGETDETNNVKAAASISLSAPDLTVTAATAPATAVLGQAVDVSWTVKNVGSTAAPAGSPSTGRVWHCCPRYGRSSAQSKR